MATVTGPGVNGIERLMKALDLQRTSFEKVYETVMNQFPLEQNNITEVQGYLKLLEQKIEAISALDKKLFDFLLENDSEDIDIDGEMAKADQYHCQFNTLKFKVENYLNTLITRASSSRSNSSFQSKILLPKIEFTKFGGDVQNWLLFWSQFRRIHEDEELEIEDKFFYLNQATKPNSKARQIVESYPLTRENYFKAIESLKSRFGREDLIIEVHVRELLKLVLNNHNFKSRLSDLYDRIETQLLFLESLNVTSDQCAAMLFPLIESCLSEELLRVWQRSSFFCATDSMKKRLDQLMKFMKGEVENEERISLATAGFTNSKQKKYPTSASDLIPTAATLVNTRSIKCVFCKKEHNSVDCLTALKLSYVERKKILSSKGCCHLCLKFGHIARKCRSAAQLKCSNCGGKHVLVMCAHLTETKNSEEVETSRQVTDNLSNHTSFAQVFLLTLVVTLKSKSCERQVRAIIDPGSHWSYIRKSTAILMGFEVLGSEEVLHSLFGGFESEVMHHKCYHIVVESLDKKYSCNFDVLDQPIICSTIDFIHEGPWMEEFQALNINLSDTKGGPIELLIGADLAGFFLSGPSHRLACGLVAFQTPLGWTLMGKVANYFQSKFFHSSVSMLNKSLSLSDMWNLDLIGISDPIEVLSKKEYEASVFQSFSDTVSRDEDGRYIVGLPFIEGHSPLPTNFEMAKCRLNALINKLDKDGYYNEYNSVFEEWLKLGIIEEVPFEELGEIHTHYLPHRHVVRLSSLTTKLRPVFDASAKQKNYPSLNNCLEKGTNLIKLIPSILLNFRWSKIGVTSDIAKAFLQIQLQKRDFDLLRFVWYNKSRDLVHFRHKRVVFGLTCSPFLLGAVIKYHLESVLKENRYVNTISKLLPSFYVDNCVTSVDSEKELRNFIKESQEVMKDAKFDLRLWEYTILDDISPKPIKSTPILGLEWDRCHDTLSICLRDDQILSQDLITKRYILSIVNKVFDPLGFTVPVLLIPKLLLQKTWVMKIGWDKEVPENMKATFLKWLKQLPDLANVIIPRWLSHEYVKLKNLSLHVFCDASKDAYSCVVFLRVESDVDVTVRFVQSKSRLIPLKKNNSVPRLELLGATIASRLWSSIVNDLNKTIESYFWTDSSTVLAWINDTNKWKPFVHNRVQEIRKLTNKDSWYHVPSTLNPADLITRGCSATQLLLSKWWEGPGWLYEDRLKWPSQQFVVEEHLVQAECRKVVTSLLVQPKIDMSWCFNYFSKYNKIIRLVAWVFRFIFNLKHQGKRDSKYLLSTEMEHAELTLIKSIQQECFHNEEDIGSLALIRDEDGILRVKTKITERDDLFKFRYPIILPAKHPLTFRLIFDTHVSSCYAGVQILLSNLREKFWIIGGRKTVKSVIRKCVVCRRHESRPCEAIPVALPRNRVKDAAVFEVIGIDLFGHMFLKNREKVWVCIFTCTIYRAIHLEIVSNLSTDSFLLAFRRFIARRGRPSIVYSDNGTNFVGAKNALESLDWEQIINSLGIHQISWKLNVVSAPWWGGWWERLIRIIKQLLRKVLGKACLTYEEFYSVLCDCESVVNSRPLTYLSEDSSDLVPITPSFFLQEIIQTGVPDLDKIDSVYLRRRCRYRLKLREDLKKRFRQEYISQLIIRKRKQYCDNVKVGDLVFLETEGSKRLDWPLALVEQFYLGKDGNVRVVGLKTKDGYVIRPIQRIFRLEMDENENKSQIQEIARKKRTEEKPSQTATDVFTRYGRKSKKPTRF